MLLLQLILGVLVLHPTLAVSLNRTTIIPANYSTTYSGVINSTYEYILEFSNNNFIVQVRTLVYYQQTITVFGTAYRTTSSDCYNKECYGAASFDGHNPTTQRIAFMEPTTCGGNREWCSLLHKHKPDLVLWYFEKWQNQTNR